ncbi:CPBP family intramembrane glutamic endopeptidase [Gymnodinialimonas ulvae]|uniref:CPBP family intramembrane glutamic endopeptidase n=1 Tax=Gymnodinialimonas ulvae TaxID=3126504 RepID=UPI0030B3477D
MQYLAPGSPYDHFVDPARARPQIWRLILGMITVVACYALGLIGIVMLVAVIAGPQYLTEFLTNLELGVPLGPTGTLLLLATFLGMALGPMLAVTLLHKRQMRTLFGAIPRTLRHFLVAMVVCALAYALSFFLSSSTDLTAGTSPTIWLSFLPLALVGVLLQTGAEEILFRGYIQQQLAARFRSAIVWMVLPSVLFGALHWQPAMMGDNAIYVVAAATLFGLLAADLTAKTGSIGAAWGFHFANNVVAILIVSLDGPLSGLALYTATLDAASPEIRPLILLDMGTTLVTWLIIRTVVTRIP